MNGAGKRASNEIVPLVPTILTYIYIYIYWLYYTILYYIIIIEYGHEAKPSIIGLQIVFWAARRDEYYDGYDYRARQKL